MEMSLLGLKFTGADGSILHPAQLLAPVRSSARKMIAAENVWIVARQPEYLRAL